MRKRYTLFFIVFISITINFLILNNILAELINPAYNNSPIKETFDKRIIVWRFDDISITSTDSRISKFVKMTENITKYGGYVGWGFIPGLNYTSTRYDPPANLTYNQEDVEKFINLISDEQISLWLHCWNHSWWYGDYGPSVWTKNLEEQREALNHTVWTFYNNFGYYPPIFSAGGSQGDVNTTIVLAERDILLLYGGSQYEPPDKRLRYLSLPSCKNSVLFGLDYYDRENILDDMKTEFTKRYNNYRILQVMLHPFHWNETTIPIFAEFTEWAYTTHDLINMNYTDAYNYKHDLECLQLYKQNDGMYTLSFYDAFNQIEITWSEQGDWIVEYAQNDTRYGELNVSSYSDTMILKPGHEYTIRSLPFPAKINKDSNQESKKDDQIPFTNILMILLIVVLIIYSLFKAIGKEK